MLLIDQALSLLPSAWHTPPESVYHLHPDTWLQQRQNPVQCCPFKTLTLDIALASLLYYTHNACCLSSPNAPCPAQGKPPTTTPYQHLSPTQACTAHGKLPSLPPRCSSSVLLQDSCTGPHCPAGCPSVRSACSWAGAWSGHPHAARGCRPRPCCPAGPPWWACPGWERPAT